MMQGIFSKLFMHRKCLSALKHLISDDYWINTIIITIIIVIIIIIIIIIISLVKPYNDVGLLAIYFYMPKYCYFRT